MSQLQNTNYPLKNKSKLPFFFLMLFIGSQGFQIPVFSLPLNWAIWPNLPDIFLFLATISVFFSKTEFKINSFNRNNIKDLLRIFIVMLFNFVIITIPFSKTGKGIKYGAYTLILWLKYLFSYWIFSKILIDEERRKKIFYFSLFAFLFICFFSLADKFSIIEIDDFTKHLPRDRAGRWGASNLDSTVSLSYGQTTLMLLMLGGIAIGTCHIKKKYLIEILIFIMGISVSFISGSRQGVVRFMVFIFAFVIVKRIKYIFLILYLLIPSIMLIYLFFKPILIVNPFYTTAVERQSVLLDLSMTNEALSGRPQIWISVFKTLNEFPLRWLFGYGMGNYVEFKNAAHNQILQLLQDGGLIELYIVGYIWIRIFERIFRIKYTSPSLFALTCGLLSSIFTASIFYANLATGWSIGLYFLSMHILYRGKQYG